MTAKLILTTEANNAANVHALPLHEGFYAIHKQTLLYAHH